MKPLVIALSLLLATTLSAATQEKIVATTVLKTTVTATGQKIVFPTGDTEVTALLVSLPAGADTGWHEHPYPRYAYVLEGAVTVENDAGIRNTYPEGSFFVEQIGTFHHGTTTVPTRLLVIDQAEAGKPNQINRSRD
ncbi:MAG TPA: cupin domain-containing protein [Stellaceae bacterium]|nr:cupin domain-containing protein [Stellaceae bacterium]